MVISSNQGRFKYSLQFLIVIFTVSFGFNFLLAQSYINDFRIKYFTLEDGLSQVSTNHLLLDKSGFLWIATQDGLNRFDGNRFTYFKNNETDTATLSGNVVNKLLEDDRGNIWVGTSGNGLNFLIPYKDIFQRVELELSGYDNEIISGITQGKDGAIWVASRLSGLHKLEYITKSTFKQSNYLPNEPLSSILCDNNGILWAGGLTGTIHKFDINNANNIISSIETQVNGNVQSLFNTGNQLLIGSDLGFFQYDLKNKTSELIELETSGIFKTKHVLSFLKHDFETVWVATGNGLYLFNWNTKEVIRKIQYSGSNDKGLSNNTVQAILKLSNEKLLVGTANYLNLLDFSKPFFSNISKNKLGEHILNDNVIFSILKDENDLWIGTSDGGLNLIRNGKVYYLTENETNPISISGSVIRAIVKDDKNNRMWLATTRGLNMLDLSNFDPLTPKFKVFHHDPGNLNSINSDFLKDIILDNNNNLWGATHDKGIFRMKMDKDGNFKIFQYKHQSDNPNSLKNDFTNCIRVDRDNNIWVGSEGGLTKLSFFNSNYDNPKFENYFKSSNSIKPLSHNSIYDILIDEKEKIWLATRSGLNLFLGNNEFESWKEQAQFPNALLYSIQNDDNGNLWLGTNDGLVKYNPESNGFSHYGVEDGIQSKEFDTHARFKDANGNIYMGGIGGVTFFNPDNLKGLDSPKPLYFSQLKIKEDIIKSTNSNYVLDKSIQNTTQLEFKQNQFPFYLQFSTIDFRFEKNVKYGFKLLPNDKEWNMLDDTEIQFLNLPSGNYKLLVNGFSRGIEWNQPPLEMELKVLPPWWATWWAYALYIVVLGGLTYTFYNFQLSKKLAVAEHIKLKALSTLKSNLYTNITHEFRTPLTVILGLADTINEDIKTQNFKNAHESISIIERNGKDLLMLVNQLLGISKAESGTMQMNFIQADVIPFLRYVSESFQTLAKTKQLDITTYFEIESLNMDFDDGKLQIVLSNLLSNAIKFSFSGQKIVFHVKKDIGDNGQLIIIKVRDYGMGIPEKAIPHIFDRFYQVEHLYSKIGKGTGIGLALSKELVMLMHGTITVKSKEGTGSEFTVSIPITKNADRATTIATSEPISTIEDKNLDKKWSLQLFGNDTTLPKVLLIEDNNDIAYYLNLCLQNKYNCIVASNGNLGLEKAFDEIPDIIICDVMMPERDGFEVCKLLKTDERTDHIPIILLTARTSDEDRLKGLQNGADAYLTKPFLKAELLTRLDQLIMLRKRITQSFSKNKLTQILHSNDVTPETKFLQKVIQIIHSNMDNPNLGSRHLAKNAGLSESQIYRKLKAITGKSTSVFIRSVRLENARDLILTSEKSISEIAYDVGFNDTSWFSRAFKEEFGQSPSAIRK